MSSIAFHSQSKTVAVRGSERFLMGGLVSDLFSGLIGKVFESDRDPHWMRKILPDNCYVLHYKGCNYEESLKTWLGAPLCDHEFHLRRDKLPIIYDANIPVFHVALNTALTVGNDAIKLAARLHGQCEIHCYTEGINRKWLAGIIQQGLDAKIFRRGMGWTGVIDFLAERDDEPVVCSYSVCEQFPNPTVALWDKTDEDGEIDYEAWYEIPVGEQWDTCLENLRTGKYMPCLELKPDDWNELKFGDGYNIFSLREKCV